MTNLLKSPLTAAEQLVGSKRSAYALFIIITSVILTSINSTFVSNYQYLLPSNGNDTNLILPFFLLNISLTTVACLGSALLLYLIGTRLFKAKLSLSQTLCIVALGQLCCIVGDTLAMLAFALHVPLAHLFGALGNTLDRLLLIWLYIVLAGITKEKIFYSLILYYATLQGFLFLAGKVLTQIFLA